MITALRLAWSRSSRRVVLAVVVACLAIGLSACGGDEGEPPPQLLLEVGLDELPEGVDRVQALDGIATLLERRATAFGAGDIDIQPQGSNRLSLSLDGFISEEEALRLFTEGGVLELRLPTLDEAGDIVCQTENGERFSISADQLSYEPETTGERPLPRCTGEGGQTGEIIWTAPTAEADQNETIVFTLQPADATVDRTGAPVLVISLTLDSSTNLEAFTEALIGLPMGIFVDDELLAGPTIEEPVTGGIIIIAGLSLREADILAAKLSVGALPLPVRVIEDEGASE